MNIFKSIKELAVHYSSFHCLQTKQEIHCGVEHGFTDLLWSLFWFFCVELDLQTSKVGPGMFFTLSLLSYFVPCSTGGGGGGGGALGSPLCIS